MLKRFLSLFRDEDPADAWDPPAPGPFGTTEDARADADALAASGRVLSLRTEPAELEGERRVIVDVHEGAGDGPPIRVSEADLHHLAGLVLDHDRGAPEDAGWRVLLSLQLRARDTPNPEGRLYLVDRRLTDGASLFFTRGTRNPALPSRLLDEPGVEAVLLRGGTLTVERAHDGVPWDDVDRHVDGCLRSHFLRCGRALRGAAAVAFADPFEGEVAELLERDVLPAVRRDGGDLRLLGVRDGVARVRLVGACRSCPSSRITLERGVRAALERAFPGRIRGVEPA